MSDGSSDLEARIGADAAAFTLRAVPEPVREKATLVLLDTVGVCIRGARTDYVTRTAQRLASSEIAPPEAGRSTVLAAGDRRLPVPATVVNAAGGTTLELDEGNQRSGHMGIHVVPASLAIAEHVGATGRDLLAALVLAYETSARIGALVRPLRAGLHPHGAWAPVGAAVATGHLLGFDADAYAEAVRLAVNPLIVGHWAAATEGATGRDFYTGLAGAHGIQAAVLAASGVTGVRDAVRRCLLPTAAGRDVDDAAIEAVAGTMGEDYFLESSYFKLHAACRYTHAPLEALGALRAEHDLRPEEIERITVRTFERGTLLDDTRPGNALAAKFSTPYALAAFLVTGSTDVEAFSEDRVHDERIRSLADRVAVVADPAFDARAADGAWGASVEVALADGTRIERTVEDARGGDDPITRAEIVAKFDRLVGGVEPAATVDRLRTDLLEIEAVADVDGLLAPLR